MRAVQEGPKTMAQLCESCRVSVYHGRRYRQFCRTLEWLNCFGWVFLEDGKYKMGKHHYLDPYKS